jgi:hypothetical protein
MMGTAKLCLNGAYLNILCLSIPDINKIMSLLSAFPIPEHHIPLCRIVNQGLVQEYQLKPCNHFVEELKDFSQGSIQQ